MVLRYLRIIFFIFIMPQMLPAAEPAREKIGTVLDTPVYRDQIRAQAGRALHSDLHHLFTRPVLKKYYQTHKADFDPTRTEINQYVAFYQKRHRQEIQSERPEIEKEMYSLLNFSDMGTNPEDLRATEIYS